MAISLPGKDMVLNAMKNKMKIESLINYYERHGFLKTLKRFLERIGFKFFKRSIFLVKMDLNSASTDLKLPYQVVIATREDIQKNHYDSWFTKEEALARFEKGYRLFVIRENDRVIASEWVEFKEVRISSLELLFHIPENAAYMTGRYTVPELRGKGFASQVDRGIFQYLKKKDYKYCLGLTDKTNVAALALNRRTGWKDYQLVNYTRFWFVKYFCVDKSNSNKQKVFITLFKAPEKMWNVFL